MTQPGPQNANDVEQHAAINIQKNYQILPSVEGASLGEYGEYNVNLYTGVPQIAIPIYSLQGNKLQAAVGLSYKASGIKVADAVSMVGSGWSLTGMPMVSRVVVGDVDMKSNYYSKASIIEDGQITPTDVSFEEYDFLYDVTNFSVETQPDQYYYSLLGKSGNFYITPSKDIIQTEYSDIIIDVVWDSSDDDIIKFTITDETGNVYTFDVLEETVMQYDDTNGMDAALNRMFPTDLEVSYNSSWHASKVETYDGTESLHYAYFTNTLDLELPVNYNLFESKVFTKCASHGASDPSPVTVLGAPMTGTFIKDKRTVESITRKVGTIEAEKLFFSHIPSDCTSSEKYTTDRKLNAIQLNRKGGPYLKRWDLTLDCSTGRLTLLNIKEQNNSNTFPGKEYTLTYNSETLPALTSNGIDHWGYFNNSSSISPTYNFATGSIDLSNRVVSQTHALAGSLASISYPTGGKTDFVFESNQITRNASSTSFTPIYNGPFTYDLESCSGANTDCCQTINGVPNTSQAEEVIYFNNNIITDGYVHIQANQIDCTQNGIPLRVVNTVTYHVRLIDETGTVTIIESETDVTGPIDKNVKIPVSLTAGFYTLDIEGVSTHVTTQLVQETTSTTQTTEFLGGLRIKEINHLDSDDTQLKKTIYKYVKAGSSVSSGLLFAKPEYLRISNYEQDQVQTIGPAVIEDDACTTVTISNSNSNELLHVQGSPVGYSRVEEIQVTDFTDDTQTNGKSIYHFHNESFSDIIADPVFNGKLQMKEILDEFGILLYTEEYNYSTDTTLYDRNIDFYGYKVVPAKLQDNKAYLIKNGAFYSWTAQISEAEDADAYGIYESKLEREDFRRMIQAYVFPRSKKETWYYGNDEISTETIYEYDNNTYLQPTKESIVNSNGREYYTNFQYPNTYPNATVKTKMVNKNIVLPAWKATQYVKDGAATPTLVDGSITEWQDFVPNIYPSKERRWEMTWDMTGTIDTSGWIDNVFYGAYDEVRGMPSTIRYRGWINNGQLMNHLLEWSPTGKLLTNTFDSYVTSYEYFDNIDQLEKVINIDETSSSYKYDDLLRLEEVKEDCTDSRQNIDYNYYTTANDANIHLTRFYPSIGTLHQDISIESKNYVDGLGRPIEAMRIRQDPNSTTKDIFEGSTYDNAGRPSHIYEPKLSIADNDGEFVSLTGESTVTEYENSPLNRTSRTTPPNWNRTSFDYGVNVTGDNVKKQYETGDYPVHSLHKTTTADPNGNKQIIFTDKIGREVLVRRESKDKLQSTNEYERSDTYSIFDDKNRVVTVIPPDALSSNADLVYTYLYSGDDLILEKKVPDQEKINFSYDDRDLMTSYQDGFLRAQSKQYNYIFDQLGRVIDEGLNNEGVTSISELLISNTYGTSAIDIDKLKICTKQLLDGSGSITTEYTYDGCGRVDFEFSNHPLNLTNQSSFIKNYSYDSQHNIIDKSETIAEANNDVHNCKMYTEYDRIGRLDTESIEIQGSPKIGLSAMTYNQKELLHELFLGQINSSSEYLQEVDYQYNPRRTLLRINNLALDGNECENRTNTSSRNNNNRNSVVPDLFYQTLMYSINQERCTDPFNPVTSKEYKNDNIGAIAWQVIGRSPQIFGYEYDYLDRITSSTSGTNTESGTVVNNLYNTSYTYEDGRGNLKTTNRTGYKQDGQNIIHGQIDMLTYSYDNNTNRIKNIVDNGDAAIKDIGYNKKSAARYNYSNDTSNSGDGNGNISYDPSREASIIYNHLNLPNSISFPNGDVLQYVYDAQGTLHQKYQIEDGQQTSVRTYVGLTEYENGVAEITHHSNGYLRQGDICDANGHLFLSIDESIDREYKALDITSTRKINPADDVSYIGEDFVKMNKGFEVPQGNEFLADINPADCIDATEDWIPHYNIKDHLGNTRVIFANLNGDNTITTDEIITESHYYPFGLEMTVPDAYKTGGFDYLYNGKELQRSFDLGYYDYGARFYNPSIGRFTSVDPLADVPHSVGLSPYHFVANNPINNIDPDGLDWFSYTNDDGNTSTLWVDSSDDTYLSQDGTSYSNIGTSYTETLTDGTAVVYNQNEVTGVYTPDEQSEALGNFDAVQQLFGEEFNIKFEAWDSDQQALMDDIYQAVNLFGVSPGENLQNSKDEGSQLFGPRGPLVAPGAQDGSLGVHKKKKQSTGSKKRLNDKHTKKRAGERSGNNRNDRRGKKNKKYKSTPNPNKKKKG